ncbi:MAG: hypothetical protein IMZ50_15545 [Candidatus Atribacteria bacterium]|nr:hypothetical protein [Candidatus Atribacteria bacterium]
MKTETFLTRKEKIVTVTCDYCDAGATRECQVCGSDICPQHIHWSDSEYGDPLYGDSGDYPAPICTRCWTIGEPLLEEAIEAMRNHDGLLDSLRAKWREATEAAKEQEPK